MADVTKFSSRGIKKQKIIQKFDSATLDLMCALAISNNDCVTTSNLRNLETLIKSIDKSDYKDSRIDKIELIERILDAKLNRHLKDPRLILSFINGGALQEEMAVDIESFSDLTTEELEWINSTISDALLYYCMDENASDIMNMIAKYQSGEYRYKSDAMNEFSRLITKANSDLLLYESNVSANDMFILSPESEDSMRAYYRENKEASNKLRCGMSGMNDMLNGGLESKRVYLILGLQGEGKSATLLDMALQITRYNPNVKPKDQTKRPCIVMISMENYNKETAERIWNMTVAPDDMTNYSEDEYIKLLYDNNRQTNIDFIHISRPADSENTNFLYKVYDNLSDKGYEVICVVQDYVKVIKPVEYNAELRISLGNVVKEFKTFAKDKDIPVLTASQINREGAKKIDEARKTNKSDLVELLGRDNTGESMLMIDFADAVYTIAPEIDYNGDKYLGICRIKGRFKQDGIASRDHIYQPYDKYLPLKLVEDELSIENMYRDSMKPDIPQNSISNATTIYPYGNGNNTQNNTQQQSQQNQFSESTNNYNQLAMMMGLPMQNNNVYPNRIENNVKSEKPKLISPVVPI